MEQTRRELLIALICSSALKFQTHSPALTPARFAWTVDRTGYIARRTVPELRYRDTTPVVIDLTPLHVALGSYMSEPNNPERIALVRYHLALVRAATANDSLPFPWREMHYGCNLLLNAERWHPAAS